MCFQLNGKSFLSVGNFFQYKSSDFHTAFFFLIGFGHAVKRRLAEEPKNSFLYKNPSSAPRNSKLLSPSADWHREVGMKEFGWHLSSFFGNRTSEYFTKLRSNSHVEMLSENRAALTEEKMRELVQKCQLISKQPVLPVDPHAHQLPKFVEQNIQRFKSLGFFE